MSGTLSAVERVLAVSELLELILAQLNIYELCRARGICRVCWVTSLVVTWLVTLWLAAPEARQVAQTCLRPPCRDCLSNSRLRSRIFSSPDILYSNGLDGSLA